METNENYTQQHQDIRIVDGIAYGDTIEHVNFAYAAKLTALNAVVLAGMAKAPAPPANVEIRGAVRPSTTLSWTKAGRGVLPGSAAPDHLTDLGLQPGRGRRGHLYVGKRRN